MVSISHWGMFEDPKPSLIDWLKREAAKPSGPAMDHEPTARFIRGEYMTTAEYQRLNFVRIDG